MMTLVTNTVVCVCACIVMSYSLQRYGLQPARLLCPWDFPGKNTGVGCCFLIQGDLPNPGVKPMSPISPALQANSLLLNHWGKFAKSRFHVLSSNTQNSRYVRRYVNQLNCTNHFVYVNQVIMYTLLLLSRFSRVQLCATPQTAAHQAPPLKIHNSYLKTKEKKMAI